MKIRNNKAGRIKDNPNAGKKQAVKKKDKNDSVFNVKNNNIDNFREIKKKDNPKPRQAIKQIEARAEELGKKDVVKFLGDVKGKDQKKDVAKLTDRNSDGKISQRELKNFTRIFDKSKNGKLGRKERENAAKFLNLVSTENLDFSGVQNRKVNKSLKTVHETAMNLPQDQLNQFMAKNGEINLHTSGMQNNNYIPHFNEINLSLLYAQPIPGQTEPRAENLEGLSPEVVLNHEFGHAVDWGFGSSQPTDIISMTDPAFMQAYEADLAHFNSIMPDAENNTPDNPLNLLLYFTPQGHHNNTPEIRAHTEAFAEAYSIINTSPENQVLRQRLFSEHFTNTLQALRNNLG